MNNENNNEEMPVVLYTSPDGKVMVNAIVKDETLWMTQAGMAELFGVTPQSVTYHLKNIFNSKQCSQSRRMISNQCRSIRKNIKMKSLSIAQ